MEPPPADRWHLSGISLAAFKSFGRPASFSLASPHLTALTGQNGSGKSNLLEAICWAAGGGASLLRGCRTLRDVTSLDADGQLPTVSLQLSRGAERHLLCTSLTPDGSRRFTIDGKAASSGAVTQFLRARGIAVGPTTIIQQAAVTRLSDSNSPAALAELVAEASGLSSWQQGCAASHQELARTQAALSDIRANIDRLQGVSAADKQAVEAAQAAAQLQRDLDAALARLLAALQQQRQQQQLLRDEAAAQQSTLQADAEAAKARADGLAAELKQVEAEQARVATVLDACPAAGELAGLLAAAEAELAGLRTAAVERDELETELAAVEQLLVQKQEAAEALQQELTLKRQAAASASSLHAASKASSGGGGARHEAAGRPCVQASAAVAAQQVVAADRWAQLQHLRARLAKARLQLLPQPADGAPADVAAAAAAHGEWLLQLQQQLMRADADAQHADAALDGRAAAALCRAHPAAVPLHKCFRLQAASEARTRQLLVALSAIAGPALLQVLTTPDIQAAKQLLHTAPSISGSAGAGGGRLKVWPLDSLRVRDLRDAQRAARQLLGALRVQLPLDLLRYGAAHEAALLHAFGGYVIAADDATAAELVRRCGLACVTMDGSVCRPGSMVGGWRGASPAAALWERKLAADAAAERAQQLRQQLAEAEQRQQQLLAGAELAEADAAAAQQAEALAGAVAAAEAVHAQEQQLLLQLQAAHDGLQQAALPRSQAANDGTAGGVDAAVQQQQQLESVAATAAADASGVAEQLEAAQDEVEQAAAALEALQLRLSALPPAGCWQELQQQQQRRLELLRQQQGSAASAAATLQQLQQQELRLQEQLALVQSQLMGLRSKLAAAAAAAADATACCSDCDKQISSLCAELPDSEAAQALASSRAQEPGLPGAAACSSTAMIPALHKQVQQLRNKAACTAAPELPVGHQERLAARAAEVGMFQQQLQVLSAAAEGLQQHIAGHFDQVHAANDAVYEGVAAGFQELCASLLPSLELQLARTGSQAHEGLQFRYRIVKHAGGADAAAGGGGTPVPGGLWQTELGMLSGGQRTLVSLAMLLAVARAGSASRLFLLDEVDAALDEHNQARVAGLLRQMGHSSNGGGSGCQILAVTHNPGFQAVCDAALQITRDVGSGGSKAADVAGKAAPTQRGRGRASKRVRFAG